MRHNDERKKSLRTSKFCGQCGKRRGFEAFDWLCKQCFRRINNQTSEIISSENSMNCSDVVKEVA